MSPMSSHWIRLYMSAAFAALSVSACSQIKYHSQEATIATHQNRLAAAKSPYLLQHSGNPVAWYEWGEEAFAKAVTEDKPIFLSIGYAACHWCHVMERESFENKGIAEILNRHFIAVKVDREERPDVDDIYMTAVQLMTGSGGWPLSVFLTPDLKPFYSGTYFPPEERLGRPGFRQLLEGIARVWKERRADVERSGVELVQAVANVSAHQSRSGDVAAGLFDIAVRAVGGAFDSLNGGFGPAPKFPPTGQIELLLRAFKRTCNRDYLTMAERTLKAMASGGIFDQLGGGFARYSTDAAWRVPHFEKMLYDNALLTLNYLDAFLITGDEFYAAIARRTLNWALTELRDPAGGFHSSLDADSEGHEGRFYIWTRQEVDALLGPDAAALIGLVYDVSDEGNLEGGASILRIAMPVSEAALRLNLDTGDAARRVEAARSKLLAARSRRIRPATDDKVLTDWNGLMIAALARAGRALGEEAYLTAATEAARFVKEHLDQEGSLLHRYRSGEAGIEGMLEDYAYLISGLLELYRATFDEEWIVWAEDLTGRMVTRFGDADKGGFLLAAERPDLAVRQKAARDGATPSANALAGQALLELHQLTGREEYRQIAEATAKAFAGSLSSDPGSHSRLAILCSALTSPAMQIAVAGSTDDPE
ncbi:MAG: thioredoxin domain-containing protein [Calditrichaeota bacterium]|nr:thioredoxin domain-containing protein [Calditrichota bacterium]